MKHRRVFTLIELLVVVMRPSKVGSTAARGRRLPVGSGGAGEGRVAG